ncbi:MAG: hypothetical protein P0Y65_10310 [Candidatus Devosia phytovorans]|uniref:Uncharacterized protein n=1 Tax=Candidatus Devosia phytovorans TaxID=3121372 RepID=A0AAJ6B2K8_9HYPH|nr:hypothetical protein [Devosia sp.]WEK06609.1 MAG: hypothetical protein P0Y65_10310 [Devosia sp.]
MPALGQGYRYIDDFDYSSPTAVAEQFTDHMANADFLSAYYLLSPEAKDAFYVAVSSGKTGTVFPGLEQFQYPALIGTQGAPRDVLDDLSMDWARLFDDMLAGATQDGQMPFSFDDGAVEVVMETPDGAEAAIDGATDGLRLGLKQTEWGEWRVESIAWSDGTLNRLWSISPEAGAGPAADLPTPRTVLDEYDFTAPDAVAETFVTAMREGDWYRAYLTLSPHPKGMILSGRQPLTMLLPGLDTADLPGTGLFRPDVKRADSLAFDTMRDTGLVFDRIMQAGDRQGVLPFDFTEAALDGVSDNVATVSTTTGALTLQMIETGHGEWRVDQVRWDGSNETAKPWGAGSLTDALTN